MTGRRRLLRALAGLGGAAIAARQLPGAWTRPIIDSVVLPVHAQASPGAVGGTGGSTCLQAGQYCGAVSGTPFTIELVVAADGNIGITVVTDTAAASVDPNVGGSFDVSTNNGRQVTGTVACGSSTITGTFIGNAYTAGLGGCASR